MAETAVTADVQVEGGRPFRSENKPMEVLVKSFWRTHLVLVVSLIMVAPLSAEKPLSREGVVVRPEGGVGSTVGPPAPDLNREPGSGPDYQRWFFANWYSPFGAVLPRAELDRIHQELEGMPEKLLGGVNSWELVGPSGMANGSGGIYSGRVLALDIKNSSGLRLAAASGGFWTHVYRFGNWIPERLTDILPSQVIGAFSTDPFEEDVIVVGTGEPWVRGGTGLYLTTDGGDSWNRIPMSPEPEAFFKIRHDLYDEHPVYAATTSGFYKSVNRGISWTRTLEGAVSDFVINPWNTTNMHAVVWGDGFYTSTDSGNTWTKITAGLPTFDLGRGAIALAPSSPGRLYVAFVRESTGKMLGIYRSNTAGGSWSTISPASNYMGKQGWYNNVLSVDPSDPDILFAGGVDLIKTTDGGTTWSSVSDTDLHADYHALEWSSDGSVFYAGHDGGFSKSTNRGATWTSTGNELPITQYWHIDTFPTSKNIFIGGTQDNGVPVTTNAGVNWNTVAADGGGVAINPNNQAEMWNTAGVDASGPMAFHRYHTTDSGVNWSLADSGLPASQNWYPQIRHDQNNPGMLLTNVDHEDLGGTGVYESRVYASSNGGLSWGNYFGSQFNAPIDFLTTSTWDMLLGRAVYVTLKNTAGGNRLWVSDGSGWVERSTGLPVGNRVRRIVPHPTSSLKAYALMNGLDTPGAKVFMTTNRGLSWTNITGNLPNVPLSDLVVHPNTDDTLYLGSSFGCFRTNTGGTTWETWNNGMPNGVIITDLDTIDRRAVFGGYWVVAGTHGHSIWKRNIAGGDEGIFSDDFETGNGSNWSVVVH